MGPQSLQRIHISAASSNLDDQGDLNTQARLTGVDEGLRPRRSRMDNYIQWFLFFKLQRSQYLSITPLTSCLTSPVILPFFLRCSNLYLWWFEMGTQLESVSPPPGHLSNTWIRLFYKFGSRFCVYCAPGQEVQSSRSVFT